MRHAIMLGTLLAVVLSVSSPASADLIYNGSFELPAVSGYGTSVDGWLCTNIEVVDAGYWPTAHGNQSIDLNGITLGSVYQQLDTVAGQNYRIQFAMYGNLAWPGLKTMDVMWGTEVVGRPSFTVTATGGLDWTYFYYDVTATGPQTSLGFVSTTTSTPTGGPALDDVSVVAIPEPATLSLIGLGLAALVTRRQRAA